MKHHSIRVARTAHYSSLGEPGPHIRYCWIACHGYGQLARRFIRKLEGLAAEDTLVIAPEGLSRFYWGGFSGQVVASWMTREDRLEEIADYCDYLSGLYQQYIPRLHPEVKIVLLGFSQGVATQLRWIMRDFPDFHELVCWAGSIPEDLDYRERQAFFAARRLHYVYGTEDAFLTPELMRGQQQLMREQHLAFSLQTFAGPHDIDPEALALLARKVRS